MLMQKSKYAKVIRVTRKVNMDNYQFYLLARVRILSLSDRTTSSLVHSLGASVGLEDGDPDGCTSCDGDSNVVTFSFHTCLVCGLDFGRVGSSFTTSLGSSSSSHPFFRD